MKNSNENFNLVINNSDKYQFQIGYLLFKDKSPIVEEFNNETDFEKRKLELKELKYNYSILNNTEEETAKFFKKHEITNRVL
jgi:hypothetical protein